MLDLGIHSIWAHRRVEAEHPLLTVIFRCGCWMEFFQYALPEPRGEWTPVYIRNHEPSSGSGTMPECRAHLLVSIWQDDVRRIA